MAKAPLMVDVQLGELHGSICGDELGAWLKINGYRDMRITADQLRLMADKLDRMQQAAATFHNVQSNELRFFSITYSTEKGEDSVSLKATSGEDAANMFCENSKVSRCRISSVYDQEAQEYVNY